MTLDGPVRCCGEFAAFPMTARAVMGDLVTEIDIIDVFTFDDAGLVKLSKDGMLALTLDEMTTVQRHFRDLGREPTDVELETIAQT